MNSKPTPAQVLKFTKEQRVAYFRELMAEGCPTMLALRIAKL